MKINSFSTAFSFGFYFFRLAWQALGSLSNNDAMQSFVERLSDLAPTFKPYVEAIWADKLEKERLAWVISNLKYFIHIFWIF